MDAKLRALLEAADDDASDIAPGGWSMELHRRWLREIETIQRKLRDELGIDMQREGCIEDATFAEELMILEQASEDVHIEAFGITIPRKNFFYTRLGIRFSNFGRLFTVWSGLESIEPTYPLPEIVALIESHGWTYVPADELEEPYDGKSDRLREQGIDWWERFFDYL